MGRSDLILALPEPAHIDVEVAVSKLHSAESAVAVGAWRRAWSPAQSALLVARRTFLPEAEAPWAETWRRRLGNVAEALAAYERLRISLRDELGVDPSEAVQEAYVRLLG